MDRPWRSLGRVPCRPLRLLARDAPEAWWDEDPVRQRSFTVHRQTRSILLLWTRRDEVDQPRVAGRRLDAFSEALAPAVGHALSALGGGRVANAILARLPEGGHIPRHIDQAAFFARAHRLHLPLIVPDGAALEVDGGPVPLQPAVLFEIDNTRPHAARNLGPGPRVHLILDVLPEGP